MLVSIGSGRAAGCTAAPPSKSMSHRLLLCAALSEGSTVRNLSGCEDVAATLACLRALGADVRLHGDTAELGGLRPLCAAPSVLDCRESASTLRFLLPLCLLGSEPQRLCGSRRLLERPMEVYEALCGAQGLDFLRECDGFTVRGPLRSGAFELPGNVSSQFVSGLLFALPLLDGTSTVRLLPPVESRPYLAMTLDALKRFGIQIRQENDTFLLPGRQVYRPCEAVVEGDWSGAAVFLALGAEVSGLAPDSLQGDRVCLSCLRALDAGRAVLDLRDCPDLGPLLFAYAALHHGGVFTGIRRLRFKESDRIAAMQEALRAFGVPSASEGDELRVGCGVHAPDRVLDGCGDHRIVMALSVLLCAVGGTIRGAEAVGKSFSDFFSRLAALGIPVRLHQE